MLIHQLSRGYECIPQYIFFGFQGQTDNLNGGYTHDHDFDKLEIDMSSFMAAMITQNNGAMDYVQYVSYSGLSYSCVKN